MSITYKAFRYNKICNLISISISHIQAEALFSELTMVKNVPHFCFENANLHIPYSHGGRFAYYNSNNRVVSHDVLQVCR